MQNTDTKAEGRTHIKTNHQRSDFRCDYNHDQMKMQGEIIRAYKDEKCLKLVAHYVQMPVFVQKCSMLAQLVLAE